MMIPNLLILSLCALPGVVVFVELFLLLPITGRTRQILQASQKSVLVMKSPKISDYWKQKAMLGYSRRIMTGTLIVTLYLALVFAGFLGGYFLFGAIFMGGLAKTAQTLYQWPTHGIILFLGIVYAFLRTRFDPAKRKKPRRITVFSSRLFHHLALDSSILKEMAFDMDCVMAKSRGGAHPGASPRSMWPAWRGPAPPFYWRPSTPPGSLPV